MSEPSDADGILALDWVPARPTSVRVSAAAHEDRVVELADDAAFLEVALERLAVLDVQVTGSPAALADVGELAVTAARGIFTGGEDAWADGSADTQVVLGATPLSERQVRGGLCFRAELDAQPGAHYRLAGIAPDVPLALEVRARDGRVLAVRTTQLAAHEWQALEIPLD
jgi:hypothetical protein